MQFQNSDNFKKSVLLINKPIYLDFLTKFLHHFVENKSGYKMTCLNSVKIRLKMK
jgi:hypothetical protein